MPKLVRIRTKSTTKSASSRSSTKSDDIIRLLKRRSGATIAEISKAVGWQPHSVRGAISGTLKRRFGLTIASHAVEGRGRVYRIIKQA